MTIHVYVSLMTWVCWFPLSETRNSFQPWAPRWSSTSPSCFFSSSALPWSDQNVKTRNTDLEYWSHFNNFAASVERKAIIWKVTPSSMSSLVNRSVPRFCKVDQRQEFSCHLLMRADTWILNNLGIILGDIELQWRGDGIGGPSRGGRVSDIYMSESMLAHE